MFERHPERKVCRACREEIHVKARICPHCRSRVSSGGSSAVVPLFLLILMGTCARLLRNPSSRTTSATEHAGSFSIAASISARTRSRRARASPLRRGSSTIAPTF